MHELISPARLDAREALQRCRRYLGTRWKRWGIARAFLPRDRRDDLIALCAWHELVRELREDETREARLESLDRLVEVLDRVFAGAARSAVGIALSSTVGRHRLPALLLRGPLEEHRRTEEVRTFETRDVLAVHAKKIAQPEGRLLLTVGGLSGEREQVLADALAIGLVLTRWLAELAGDLRRGLLHLAVEDLVRHGVDLRDLREGRLDPRIQALIGDQVAWARSFLAKGWPLCRELGRWRGRELAFLLRWNAATLSALEARRYDALRGRPPAGWPRLVACASVSLATPEPPAF